MLSILYVLSLVLDSSVYTASLTDHRLQSHNKIAETIGSNANPDFGASNGAEMDSGAGAIGALALHTSKETEHDAQVEKIRNVTHLLESVLLGYDKNLRPNAYAGTRDIVSIDILIRSMGPISEREGSFALDCYFRQSWNDPRLQFSSESMQVLSLGMSMLDKIWKPDTYFWNGKGSYLHKLTQPNRLVRLKTDGTVLYSSRLTIVGKCSMDLRNFPLDAQLCPLLVGGLMSPTRFVGLPDLLGCLCMVSYPTALDVYIIICFAFLFAAVLEFAAVHVHTKYNTGDPETRYLEHERVNTRRSFMRSAMRQHMRRTTRTQQANKSSMGALLAMATKISIPADMGNKQNVFGALPNEGVENEGKIETQSSSDEEKDCRNVENQLHNSFTPVKVQQKDDHCMVYRPSRRSTYSHKKMADSKQLLNQKQRMSSPTCLDIPSTNQGTPHAHRYMKKYGSYKNYSKLALATTAGAKSLVTSPTTTPTHKTHLQRRKAAHSRMVTPPSTSHHSFSALADRRHRPSIAMRMLQTASRQNSVKLIYRKWVSDGKKADVFDTEANSISRIDRIARLLFPVAFLLVAFIYWYHYLRMTDSILVSE